MTTNVVAKQPCIESSLQENEISSSVDDPCDESQASFSRDLSPSAGEQECESNAILEQQDLISSADRSMPVMEAKVNNLSSNNTEKEINTESSVEEINEEQNSKPVELLSQTEHIVQESSPQKDTCESGEDRLKEVLPSDGDVNIGGQSEVRADLHAVQSDVSDKKLFFFC